MGEVAIERLRAGMAWSSGTIQDGLMTLHLMDDEFRFQPETIEALQNFLEAEHNDGDEDAFPVFWDEVAATLRVVVEAEYFLLHFTTDPSGHPLGKYRGNKEFVNILYFMSACFKVSPTV